jgi:hypothetical protein
MVTNFMTFKQNLGSNKPDETLSNIKAGQTRQRINLATFERWILAESILVLVNGVFNKRNG